MQRIVLFVGCDNTGKTTIAKRLSNELKIPYFKNSREKEIWTAKTYNTLTGLAYEQPFILQFLEQTGYSVIIDRGHLCEEAYSEVFERKTDKKLIKTVDTKFASLNARVILCVKPAYELLNGWTREPYSKESALQVQQVYL